jgi:hypothetical protein
MEEVVLKAEDWKCLDSDIKTTIGIAFQNYLMLELPFQGRYKFTVGSYWLIVVSLKYCELQETNGAIISKIPPFF